MVGKHVGMHSGHVLKKFNFGQKMLEKGRKTCPGHVWKFSFFGQKMFENGRKICLRFFEKITFFVEKYSKTFIQMFEKYSLTHLGHVWKNSFFDLLEPYDRVGTCLKHFLAETSRKKHFETLLNAL